MNPEVKALWIAALRSGQYKQGQDGLRAINPDKPDEQPLHCCLGVLCDLHAIATGGVWTGHAWSKNAECYMGSHELLPERVKEWAGLDSADPAVYPITSKNPQPMHRVGLSRCNDGLVDYTFTFPEIADLIEAQL